MTMLIKSLPPGRGAFQGFEHKTANKRTCLKCVYHILFITYMFRSLLRLSSVYLHKNT